MGISSSSLLPRPCHHNLLRRIQRMLPRLRTARICRTISGFTNIPKNVNQNLSKTFTKFFTEISLNVLALFQISPENYPNVWPNFLKMFAKCWPRISRTVLRIFAKSAKGFHTFCSSMFTTKCAADFAYAMHMYIYILVHISAYV